MAKPATRMKSIVLKSYSALRAQQRASTPPPSAQHRNDSAALNVCCEQPATLSADADCSAALGDDLRATIEEMVIPRLLIRQCLPHEASSPRRGRVLPTVTEVELLARIAVQPDLEKALELALGMQGAGLSLETVLLHLIGPAARRLGTDWEEDLRSFADVTVGLGTLHELVHLLARRDASDAIEPSVSSHSGTGTEVASRRALLLGGPGEQHTLGLYIFAELLRHSHWIVALEAHMPDSAVLQTVRTQSIDVVGIAVSNPERFPAVAELIRRLLKASQNRALRVIVGGPVDLTLEAQQAGATFYSDARDAVEWLDGE